MGVFDVTFETPVDSLLACSDEDVGQLLELDEIVGKGGFATVWKATFDGQVCACKVLQPRGGTLPPSAIVRLFIRECISLMSMDHSAVIRCAGLIRMRMVNFPELGLTYDTYGMLLEFCEGGTLKDLLLAQLVYKQDQYSVREALSWLAQVASALHQFHSLEMPIIHRDIKPENVLLQVQNPSGAPGAFWQPPQQQQQTGMPRLRLGTGGSSFRPREYMDARLADLGLGVRVCANRSVLIRRRTTPVEDASGAVAGSGGSTSAAATEDDEAIKLLFDGGAPSVPATATAAAPAGASGGAGGGNGGGGGRREDEVRLPFMGFTTTPIKPPPKRVESNQRKTSRRRSSGAGAGIAAAAAAAVDFAYSGAADVPASPQRAETLHRTTLLNNIRVRLSSNRESTGSWAALGEAAAAAAAAGGTIGGSRRMARASSAVVEIGSTAATGGSGGGGGNVSDRASVDGPSPFRDYLQQQQQNHQQQQKQQQQVAMSGGTTSTLPGVALNTAGGPAPDATGMTSRANVGGVGSDGGGGAAAGQLGPPAPFALQYGQGLGHVMAHSPLTVPLAPISERSLSAEDTIGGSDCRSGSGSLTSTNPAGAVVKGAVQTPINRTTPLGTRKSQLYTIQEPSDDNGPLLPTTASAPAAPGDVRQPPPSSSLSHLRNTQPNQQAAPHPSTQHQQLQQPHPHHHHHHQQLQQPGELSHGDPTHLRNHNHHNHPMPGHNAALTSSNSLLHATGSSPRANLVAAAAASMKNSLRRAAVAAAVAAAAVAGALSSRPAPANASCDGGSTPHAADTGAPGPGGAGGAGDHDNEPPLLLQSTTSVPIPTCRIDLDEERPPPPPPPPPNQRQRQQLTQQQHVDHFQNQQPLLSLGDANGHGPRPGASAIESGGAPPAVVATATPPPSPPPPTLVVGYGSRGSRGHTGISATAATAAVNSQPLPRGETLTASATATATATVTATLSGRASKDRFSFGLSSIVRPTLRELRHAESLTRAMRRVGSLLHSLKVASLPKFRRNSQFQWVYGLTGQAGSCMYMAPEVFRGEPYNEKVDVHSFGVMMMYELLARDLLLVRYIGGTRAGMEAGVRDPHQYAKKVCEGFRPPRHPRIPEAQWQLIQACWHPDPLLRPDMAEVASLLEAAINNWDGQHPPSPKLQQHQKQLTLPRNNSNGAQPQQQRQQQLEQQNCGSSKMGDNSVNGGYHRVYLCDDDGGEGGGESGRLGSVSTRDPGCHCVIS